MKYISIIKKLYKGENGGIAIIVALSTAALLGFGALSLDLGMSYYTASKLQNALDSAVLAAVKELPATDTTSTEWLKAVNKAIEYADKNGVKLKASELKPVTENGKIIGIEADGNAEVNYTLARILGYDRGSLNRNAESKLKAVGGMKGLIPLAVRTEFMDSIKFGDGITLKVSSNDDYSNEPGWFGTIVLDGNGAKEFKTTFIEGCDSEVEVGQVKKFENGKMAGPTIQAFEERIKGHESCSFESHEKDCPRIVTAPVVTINIKGANGKGESVTIQGFASFFLTDVTKDGNDKASVEAKYISTIVTDGSTIGASKDYGVYTIKLTK